MGGLRTKVGGVLARMPKPVRWVAYAVAAIVALKLMMGVIAVAAAVLTLGLLVGAAVIAVMILRKR